MAYNVLNNVSVQALSDATTPLTIKAHSVTQTAPLLIASVADTSAPSFPVVFKGSAFGNADAFDDPAMVCTTTNSSTVFSYGQLWIDVSNFGIPVTSIQVSHGNIVTVTCANNSGGDPIIVPGSYGYLFGLSVGTLTVATFLNGQFITVMRSDLTSFTASISGFSHADYGPTAETGTVYANNGAGTFISSEGGLNFYQLPSFSGIYYDNNSALGPNGSGSLSISGGAGSAQYRSRFSGQGSYSFTISATSISSNILTVTHNSGNPIRPGATVRVTGTAESYLNGQSFIVLTSTQTQITAYAPYSDYSNGSDTGTLNIDSIDCGFSMSGGNGGEGGMNFDVNDHTMFGGTAFTAEGGTWQAYNPATGNIGSRIVAGSITIEAPTYPVTGVSSVGTTPITSVANASGGNTTYTGTFPNDVNINNKYTVISGFTNAANNGLFTIVSNNATQLVVNNAFGVSETHAATASMTATYAGTFPTTSWAGLPANIQNFQLPAWQASHSYALGFEIVDYNGGTQQVTTAGMSGASAPSWQAAFSGVGTTTTDSGVVWTKRASQNFQSPNTGTYTVVSNTASTLVVNNPQAQVDGTQIAVVQPQGQFTQYAAPAAFGVPAPIIWPAVTGNAGQFLVTNGANPQQLSWSGSSGVVTFAGTTTHSVTYSSTVTTTNPPVVVATPKFDPATNDVLWITDSGSANNWTGFTVNFSHAQTGDVNYIVMGN